MTYGYRLADCIDGGGRVLQYAYDNWNRGTALLGRFDTGGYAPFVVGDNPDTAVSLGTYNATHPSMQGVGELHSSLNTAPTLASGRSLAASWDDGRNAIASKGNVASVGADLGDGYWSGDHVRLAVNAISRLATGSPDPLDFGDQARDTVSPVGGDVHHPGRRRAGRGGRARSQAAAARGSRRSSAQPPTTSGSRRALPEQAATTTTTCTAKVRFIRSAAPARTADLRFSSNTSSDVTLQGVGSELPGGSAGTDGTDGTDGAPGSDGAPGANAPGTSGAPGADGAAGTNGTDGTNAVAPVDLAVRSARTKVRCRIKAYGRGSRAISTFNGRSRRSSLVQLRDRRGALSTARGNGRRRMVFLSKRKPYGSVYAFVIRGLPTR